MNSFRCLLLIATGMDLAFAAGYDPPDPRRPIKPADIEKQSRPMKYRMYLQSADEYPEGVTAHDVAARGGPYVDLDVDPTRIYQIANQPPFRIWTVPAGGGTQRIQTEHVRNAHPSRITRIPIRTPDGEEFYLHTTNQRPTRDGTRSTALVRDGATWQRQHGVLWSPEERLRQLRAAHAPEDVARLLRQETPSMDPAGKRALSRGRSDAWRVWAELQNDRRLRELVNAAFVGEEAHDRSSDASG